MDPIVAILLISGTTGLVAYLVTRRARAAAARPPEVSGD